MGIYESMQRSGPAIDTIADKVQAYFKQQKLEENQKRFQDMVLGTIKDRTQQPAATASPATSAAPMDTQFRLPNQRDIQRKATNERFHNALLGRTTNSAPGGMPSQTTEPGGKDLYNLSYEDVLQLSQMVGETPELGNEVNMYNQASAARKPKTMLERLHTRDRKQWINRGGQLLYDFPQEGDRPYSKPSGKTTGGKSAVIKTLETDKTAKEKYIATRYPDVDLKAALKGTYPAPPTNGRSAEEILQAFKNGEDLKAEEKTYVDKLKAVDAYVKAFNKLYARYDDEGSEYDDPFENNNDNAAPPAANNPQKKPKTNAGGYIVGKTYTDPQGYKAQYQADGTWKEVL